MILLRHGETEFNVVFSATRVDPGIEDPALTANGQAQIADAAQKLRGHGVKNLIASPYKRAIETAEIVSSVLDVAVAIDADVRERYAFACDIGSPTSELATRWRQFAFDHLEEIWWPSEEEPEHQLHDRCQRFSNRMAERADWAHTLVVTHWGVIRALTGERIKNGQMMRFDPVSGTAKPLIGGA